MAKLNTSTLGSITVHERSVISAAHAVHIPPPKRSKSDPQMGQKVIMVSASNATLSSSGNKGIFVPGLCSLFIGGGILSITANFR